MPSLAAIRTSNASFKHSTSNPPVAVFVGGTSGIGKGMAEVFADNTKGNSHIVLVGRNRDAAERILSSLPKPDKGTVAREFVQCDATLMKNVQQATTDILARYPKINYLVMSPGIMTLDGRTETTEGIDKKLAVHYYARWKFLHDLLPGLQKAKDEDEEVAVMSVLAPSHGGAIDVNDLALKTGYSLSKAALVTPTYNDLMIESFAEQERRIPFIHSFPGFVRTSIASSSNSWLLSKTSGVLLALTRPLSVSAEECAQYMWHGIYSTANAPGAWRTGANGEDLKKKKYFGDEEQRTKLWEHTVQVMKDALASK
ncbi:NAD(P)-binding protein [Pholiota conissans]|uniref:NAD(P)-binding protein n=1 Tax=Pholiota conissans TaxID=109636 RepID=A0A9P6CTR6_9AGAR|nr:NAD(P)-binding protein [Pholiota conissans]